MTNLTKALLEVQKEVGAIKKDATNPYFKSKYADINAFIEVVKPILSKHGVVLLQPLDNIDGKHAIRTILLHAKSGESVESVTPLVSAEDDPQKFGSAVTYYRRYALQSFLFLQAEDDDANAATGKAIKTRGPADEQSDDDLNF